MTLFGVNAGNDPDAYLQFEEWLGRDLDFVRGHGGRANWADHVGSLGWLASQFSGLDTPVYWSVPMIVQGATLAQAATGGYNQHYLAAAKTLLTASEGLDAIHVRIGEEFNGDWMPWAAKGKEADFIATFRQIVQTFRSVSDKFVFEWNVNIGDMGMDPALAWPGNDYVDVIGMDFYWNLAWDPQDPEAAWTYMVNRKYGLQWLEDFADAHGKPTAYSEWGVNSDDAGAYVQSAMAWFASHDVLYQSYWNSNADFPGMLSSGQYPATGAAFIEAFAGGAEEGTADFYAVVAGGRLAVAAAGGVLANDGAAGVAVDLVAGPAHGALELKSDGSFVYVPDAGFAGIDGFGYAPRGASGSGAPVTAMIEVAPPVPAGISPPPISGAWTRWIGGTAGNDALTGTAGNDKIDGRSGTDTMTGGNGDDDYTVDRPEDRVIEKAGEGIDRVVSYAPRYQLDAQVENLDLIAGYVQTGIGNALDNRIAGSAANNRIEGGAGNDWLTGGGGADTFVYKRGHGHDTITDFARADFLDLRAVGFASFGEVRDALTDTARGATLVLPGSGTVTLLGVEAASLTAANVFLADLAAPAAGGAPVRWSFGTAAAETLVATAANDALDGVGGADRLAGGAGDDVYLVRGGIETVVERPGEGIDTVRSRAAFHTLADNVEHLRLVGDAGQTGIGNGLNNRIMGGAGNDLLDGVGGDDWLSGGTGRDTFRFAPGGGNDVIADFEVGAGGDRLDLSAFWIDTIEEVRAAITVDGVVTTLRLGDGLSVAMIGVDPAQLTASNLAPTGISPPPISGAWTRWIGGTAGNDALTGTAGNDKIDGRSGTDTMTGGNGDDDYTVDRPEDRVIEKAGEGIDRVVSYAPRYQLDAQVENLDLIAGYVQTGIGNALDNRIAGSAANNRIEGGAGNDWLTGGGGADTFVFARGGGGRDVISDFGDDDRIDLSGYDFAGFGALAAGMTEGEGHVTIHTGEGDAIRLLSLHLADVEAAHFVL